MSTTDLTILRRVGFPPISAGEQGYLDGLAGAHRRVTTPYMTRPKGDVLAYGQGYTVGDSQRKRKEPKL